MKTFPILKSCLDRCREQHFQSPRVVSFDLVKRHEAQALANHGQTVERLAERGGLSWFELLMVISDKGSTDEYWTRIEGLKLSEGGLFRIVSVSMMHEFSDAYAPGKK
jgi:hypothetical protein